MDFTTAGKYNLYRCFITSSVLRLPLSFYISSEFSTTLYLNGISLLYAWTLPGNYGFEKAKETVGTANNRSIYSRTSNNGHCRGIQILSVIGGVR
jgi:hypothetical protein